MKTPDYVQYPYEKSEALRVRYGQTLAALGETNSDIVVLDADLSTSTQTAIFAKKFPTHHIDVGIAEADMIGTAAGLAASGMVPYASSFAMFAVGRAYDQVRNAVAYADLPVRIVATHAGITVGEDGGSHQMIEDIAMMRVLPNMSVIVPADAQETEAAIRFAAAYNHPLYIRLGRDKFPLIYKTNYKFQFGKWDVIAEGDGELVIIACGLMVSTALDAAAILEKEHAVNATVVNASTIKPADEELLAAVAKKAKLIVTAEEALIAGGLGGLVSEYCAAHEPRRVLRIGIDNRFGQSGTPAALLEGYELTAPHIAQKIISAYK